MAAATKNAKKRDEVTNAVSDVGQYRGHNPYWFSSLFSEVYLRNDVPRKYAQMWDSDAGFETFQQQFHNLVVETEDENFGSWSESDTIKNWIVHVMEMLGWHDKCASARVDPYITELSLTIQEDGKKRTYRADMVYVDEPKFKQYITKEESPEGRLREARSEHTGALMVLEAKYWDRLEHARQNKPEEKRRADLGEDDGTRHLDPNDQILKYMEILHRDFGILSDGKTWRLFHRDLSKGDIRRYFEFDLGNLADLVRSGVDNPRSRERYLQEARYFYFFFRKASLIQQGTTAPFVHEVLEYSKRYASSIEEDLKQRFIEAMGFACNSLKASAERSGEKVDLEVIRSVAESHLFNILFIRSCETRKILPINATAYHRLSLTEITESLEHMNFDPEKGVDTFIRFFKMAFGETFKLNGSDIYDRLMKLYSVVHDGDMGFGVVGFQESVFTRDEWKAAKRVKIDNEAMIRVLFSLNFTDSEYGARKYQQIQYSFFTPRQLGSIYESFLEFKLEKAETFMIMHQRQWKAVQENAPKTAAMRKRGSPAVSRSEFYFTPDNKDRKMTGAYYTPDHVVEFIVTETLAHLCKGKDSKAILQLRVCDPAMGSGHFLSGALRFVTNAHRKASADELAADVNESFEESARRVLDQCIFGVDINPRAVKLAKMSLWLATALAGKKLECLDDQLRCGNSLIGRDVDGDKDLLKLHPFDWETEFPFLKTRGFDVIVGNPPYSLVGSDRPAEQRYFTSGRYALNNYKINTYVLFLEKGLSLLRKGGSFGFILPKSLVFNQYFSETRRRILTEKLLNKIVETQEQVFEGAEVGDSIVALKVRDPSDSICYETFSSLHSRQNLLSSESSAFSDLLGKEPFHFRRQKVVTSTAKTEVLGEVAEVYNGLNPGNVRHVLLAEKKLSGKHRKMLLGRDIRQFSIDWSGTWVNFDPTLKDSLTTKDIKSKEGMTAQKKVDFALRDPEIYRPGKILIRKTGDCINAAFDEEQGFYFDSLAYGVFLKDGVRESMHYITAVLNSSYIDRIHAELSQNKGKVFAKVLASNIKRLPIRRIDFANKGEKSIHDRIVALAKKSASGDQGLRREIDELVESLYGVQSRRGAA